MKKMLSLALSLVLLLGLAACGNSFEDAMAKAQAASAELESMHFDMTMEMSYSISADGQSIDMPVSMDMSMDVINEPFKCDGTVTMDMMGVQANARSYITSDSDGSYVSYTSADDGATWQTQTLDEDQLGQYDASKSLEFYLDAAESFSLTGEEELDGVKALRYDGAITGDKLNEAMALTGADDMISSTAGTEAPSFEGSMAMTIWLDSESYLPLRYDLDMGEIMTNYMQQTVSGADGVTIDSVIATVSMRLSNFDGISDIPVPEGIA